ncbi:MAG TPA: A/G-specific adenine glycosylase [Bauldia sp.]|nr:A/G-specific adenine glycosylase [Bauldia sp.]
MTPDPDALLAWYDRHARKLPWRVGPKERARGVVPDPYRVWLSEVMLQQTSVAAVKPRYDDFVARWPNVAALAAAAREDVMRAWTGLGYYARARNMKACADAVVAKHGGVFPRTAEGLRALPGIGAYTAAAVAAIAFDEPVAVVDANIERVIARLFAIETPVPAAKAEISRRQQSLTPSRRAGDFAQAMMDLGSAICTPKRPACALCPFSGTCVAHARGAEDAYPRRGEKAPRPERFGIAFVARRRDGAVLLRRRADSGLLGGMVEVPGSEWTSLQADFGAISHAPLEAEWRPMPGPVVHVFTHFRLELAVMAASVADEASPPPGCWWEPGASLPYQALPSVMKKVIEAAIPGATAKGRSDRVGRVA